jgi:hypothetical protein
MEAFIPKCDLEMKKAVVSPISPNSDSADLLPIFLA